MNMYLVNRYQIPTTLDPNISNPGIKEVDYEGCKAGVKRIKNIYESTRRCSKERESFDVEDLLFF